MTYHELVEKVRTALVVKADASKIKEHIAAQVNVTGEAEGAFYIEIKEDAPNPIVEAFDYNDRDFLLTGDGEEILAVAQGKKTLEAAIVEGTIAHEGNWEKTLVLSGIIPAAKKTSKKTKPAEEVKEVKAEEPAEGQLAFTEETAPAAEEAPAVEEAPAIVDAPAEAPATEEPAPAKKGGRRKTEAGKSTTKTTTKRTKKAKN